MIRSMTGYGRSQCQLEGMNISVEIKSVNSRYLEFSPKVYRGYSFLEEKLKSYIQSVISRGKVECYVSIDALQTDDVIVQLNESLASGYVDAIKTLCDKYALENDFKVSHLAMHNDIFAIRKSPADEEKIWNCVKTVLEQAIKAFVLMRETEGEKLKNDILSRADLIIENIKFIENRSPETVKEYNNKLIERMKELLCDTKVDESRVINEAAIFADKIAVAEETVRLRSHIDQLHDFMNAKEPIGRKLDFLVQEINREANTIGSKASDIDIARKVIDIKAEVEKIREQIQNIE